MPARVLHPVLVLLLPGNSKESHFSATETEAPGASLASDDNLADYVTSKL